MTQFVIYRNGRRYNNKSFETYEAARKYAIKKVRATDPRYITSCAGNSVKAYPALEDACFTIKRVAA